MRPGVRISPGAPFKSIIINRLLTLCQGNLLSQIVIVGILWGSTFFKPGLPILRSA